MAVQEQRHGVSTGLRRLQGTFQPIPLPTPLPVSPHPPSVSLVLYIFPLLRNSSVLFLIPPIPIVLPSDLISPLTTVYHNQNFERMLNNASLGNLNRQVSRSVNQRRRCIFQ